MARITESMTRLRAEYSDRFFEANRNEVNFDRANSVFVIFAQARLERGPEVTGGVTGEDGTKFRHQFLNPLLEMSLIKMTISDKPRSSKQRYRLTEKGRGLLTQMSRDS